MIYIPNTNHDPALNLAMEEYILSSGAFTEPVLFFYVNAPSIIIGRHQNTLDEINESYVHEHGIRVVRRCSGGGAVYHDLENLNYSLIRPGDRKAVGDFSVLLTPILEALHALGLPAELGGRNDLLLNGAKFSGNAYYHNRSGSVTHGTLLFDSDLGVLSKALLPAPHKLQAKGISSVRSRVCCIKDHLPGIRGINDLKEAIIRFFMSRESISTRNFNTSDMENIENLADNRYRSDLWNYGESPSFTERHLIHTPAGWIDFRTDIRKGTVCHVRFFGDYFCSGEISELEAAWPGTHWGPDPIAEMLQRSGWAEYFPGFPVQDFIRELFSTKANA